MKLGGVMFMNSVLKIRFQWIQKDSIYYCDLNKKVLGKIKDEFGGVKLVEFVELKSKMYSLIACNDLEVNKA